MTSDGNLFIIKEFSLPKYEDESNFSLKALVKNRHCKINQSGYVPIHYPKDHFDYCQKCRNRFIDFNAQLENINYKIVTDDE